MAAKPGRFELAHGGTLFLDEIGEIPIEMQVKLLRVLQESEFERVGGIKTIKVDVRLVAATNRDLLQEIAAGGFREDLFYRLNVVPIDLPPLRERREDIPLLAEHFLTKFNDRLKKQIGAIAPEAVERLIAHTWPGNIRELENLMERTMLFCEGPAIHVADLPPEIVSGFAGAGGGVATPTAAAPPSGSLAVSLPLVTPVPVAAGGLPAAVISAGTLSAAVAAAAAAAAGPGGAVPPGSAPGVAGVAGEEVDPTATGSLKEAVRVETERVERELIQRALDATGGNVTQAARKLKISRKSLQTKMKELGLRTGG